LLCHGYVTASFVSEFKIGVSVVSMVRGSGIGKDTAHAKERGVDKTYIIVQFVVCSFILVFIPLQKAVLCEMWE
jgi:hypothetical protein